MNPATAFSGQNNAAAANRYLEDRVATASPAELTAMLFDAALGNITLAQALFSEKMYLQAQPHIVKAQEILLELRCSLNPEAGDLALALEGLYNWIWSRLLDANANRDPALLQESYDLLEPIQQAWRTSVLGQGSSL